MEVTHEFDIVEMDCATPRFQKGQRKIDSEGIYDLDSNNCLVVVHNAIDPEDIDYVIEQEIKNKRYRPQIRGHFIPRLQMCYTNDGEPLFYSGVHHHSIKYPDHAIDISNLMMEILQEQVPVEEYKVLSDGISLVYSKDVERGGYITAHGDMINRDWGIICIFSLGQARWMRFRRNSDGEYINVKLRHNSFVYMVGENFQKLYTHQIDKFKDDDEVGDRLSINVRWTRKK